MRLLVELSAEHPTLPAAELAALAGMVGGQLVERDGSVAILDVPDGSDAARFIVQRAALAHTVSAHWWTTAATPRVMVPPFGRIDMKGQSFAIRARRLEGHHTELPLQDTVKAIGALLAASGKVDLESPDVDIRVLLAEDAHVGALLGDIDRKQLEARHVKHRVHFSPVAIHPKWARALVNMAQIRPGERVSDPFCGTGGLVLEAGLVGAQVYGSDFDARMATGTRATLEKFGVPVAKRNASGSPDASSEGAIIETRDVGELPEFAPNLDVVISDPPYGQSSTTNQEERTPLYERFFAAAHEALKPGGRLALISPSAELRERAAKRFTLVQAHDQRVHKSMTRHYGIFVREP